MELVDFFLSNGCEEQINEACPSTPMQLLCSNESVSLEVLQLMVSKGADMATFALTNVHENRAINFECFEYLANVTGEISLEEQERLCQYVFAKPNCDVRWAKLLLSKGVKFKEICKVRSNFFLHKLDKQKAVDLELLQFLHDNGADLRDKGFDDRTPLFILLENGAIDEKFLEFCLQIGSVNEDFFLHAVCGSNTGPNLELIRLLVEKKNADVNLKETWCQYSPLHCLFVPKKRKNMKTPSYLIEKGVEAVSYLIEKGADINARDFYGHSVLYSLVDKNHSCEIIKLLFEKGVKFVASEDGPTLTRSLIKCELETLKYMIEKGVSADGMLRLYCLLMGGSLEHAEYLFEKDTKKNINECLRALCNNKKASGKVMIFLVEKGADLNFESCLPCLLKWPKVSEHLLVRLLVNTKHKISFTAPKNSLFSHLFDDYAST